MDQVRNFTQAYSQAPWRKQLQWIGIFLTCLTAFLLAASIFISITSKTAAVGKDIQRYRLQAETLGLEIANMQSQLAILTSAATLKDRAIKMGFRPASPDEIIYVNVPGYTGDAIILGSTPQMVETTRPELSAAFTQSWVDWFIRQFRAPKIPLAELSR